MKRHLLNYGHYYLLVVPVIALATDPTVETAFRMVDATAAAVLWFLIIGALIRFVLLMRYFRMLRYYRRTNPVAYYVHVMQQALNGE